MKRRWRRIAVLVVALILGIVLYPAIYWTVGSWGTPLDLRTVALLRTANRVEVFRVDGMNGPGDGKEQPGEDRLQCYLVIGRGPAQGEEFAGRLAAMLTDRHFYTKMSKGCFWPGVAYRLHGPGGPVDVLVCFQCDNVAFSPHLGRSLTFFDSPLRPRLVELAKESLPADQVIQRLE